MSQPRRLWASKRPVLRCMFLTLVLFSTVSMDAQDGPVDAAMASIRPEAIRADMRFLSDDLLEGRGTATRGFDIAAKFMATQFEGMGLQPAGDNGTYFQNVPLRLLKADPAKSALSPQAWRQRRRPRFRQGLPPGRRPGACRALDRSPGGIRRIRCDRTRARL